MICKRCRIKNEPDNKYCSNCGEELTSAENDIDNVCSKCGTENEPGYKFCTSCGFKLANIDSQAQSALHSHNSVKTKEDKVNHQINNSAKYSHKDKLQHYRENIKNRNKRLQKLKGLKALWIIVGVVILSVIFVSAFDLIFHKYPSKQEKRLEVKSSNPVIEAKVLEIASKFVCSCGNCNEESLEICKCERAVEERQFIRDYLEQNQKPDDIVIAVANKYGWMKAEFASNYNVDASSIWNPNQLQVTKELINTNPGILNNKASISDRFTIYSAFTCPCGRCKKDELRDCTCKHPNGAVEIKKFIDEKIIENKYTINDIIQIVDKKFGGKKI